MVVIEYSLNFELFKVTFSLTENGKRIWDNKYLVHNKIFQISPLIYIPVTGRWDSDISSNISFYCVVWDYTLNYRRSTFANSRSGRAHCAYVHIHV